MPTTLRRIAVATSLVVLLGAAPTAAATTIASGHDAANDVKITGPKKSGPSKKLRKSIDIRKFEVIDNGPTRTIKIKVKKLAKGRFGGWDQLFYFTSFTSTGIQVAGGGFSHRPSNGGWSYSDVNQESCEFRKIRRNRKVNTISATVPAECFPVPSGGRVRINTIVGIYRSDAPSYSFDKVTKRVSADW